MNPDIRGIDKAEILVALYEAATPPTGIAALEFDSEATLTVEEAREILGGYTSATPYPGQPMHVDYVKGRNIKTDLSDDELDPTQFNRIHGEGKAQRAIDGLGYHTPSGLMPSGRATNNEDVYVTDENGTWLAYSGASDLHYMGPDDDAGFYMP